MRGRKYREGEAYTSMNSLLKDLDDGKYVYWCSVVKHPSIISNMRLKTIKHAIELKIIKKAIKNKATLPFMAKTVICFATCSKR